ncbi:hypothetical protein AB1N83_002092 [Pleurotus pulmonarius]
MQISIYRLGYRLFCSFVSIDDHVHGNLTDGSIDAIRFPSNLGVARPCGGVYPIASTLDMLLLLRRWIRLTYP